MTQKYKTAETILRGTGINILNAAIIIRSIIDSKNYRVSLDNFSYCKKIAEFGGFHFAEAPKKSLHEVFAEYEASKSELKPESLKDIRKLGKRILRKNPGIEGAGVAELRRNEIESVLERAFETPSQFNKGRMMLHGLFNFALRREYCEKNPVSLIPKKRVIEKEIRALSMAEIRSLYECSEKLFNAECLAGFALMLWAGIRPREVRALRWSDVDLRENIITIRSKNSKTGGTRHVTILPALKRILLARQRERQELITPPNWEQKWRKIRASAGFETSWQQDVLRHTFATYHAKFFKNLPRLQMEMGHCNLSLLRSRYINMRDITKRDAKDFFAFFSKKNPACKSASAG